jgi:hypothetical protein
MKGFKGFNKGLVCTPNGNRREYREGGVHEEAEISICKKGIHFCENPLSVLRYYLPQNGNEYAEVESFGGGQIQDDKVCTKKLFIRARISLSALIKAAILFVKNKQETVSSEDSSTSATSGNHSTSATSGNHSTSATSGYSSTSATSGDHSTSATSGDYSTSKVIGKHSIAVANGKHSRASGAMGCYIVLTEYSDDGDMKARMFRVNGKKVKADTLYTLKGGKLTEAEHKKER